MLKGPVISEKELLGLETTCPSRNIFNLCNELPVTGVLDVDFIIIGTLQPDSLLVAVWSVIGALQGHPYHISGSKRGRNRAACCGGVFLRIKIDILGQLTVNGVGDAFGSRAID